MVGDDPEASVLRLELGPGRVEWFIFNPQARTVPLDSATTSEPFGYLDFTRSQR